MMIRTIFCTWTILIFPQVASCETLIENDKSSLVLEKTQFDATYVIDSQQGLLGNVVMKGTVPENGIVRMIAPALPGLADAQPYDELSLHIKVSSRSPSQLDLHLKRYLASSFFPDGPFTERLGVLLETSLKPLPQDAQLDISYEIADDTLLAKQVGYLSIDRDCSGRVNASISLHGFQYIKTDLQTAVGTHTFYLNCDHSQRRFLIYSIFVSRQEFYKYLLRRYAQDISTLYSVVDRERLLKPLSMQTNSYDQRLKELIKLLTQNWFRRYGEDYYPHLPTDLKDRYISDNGQAILLFMLGRQVGLDLDLVLADGHDVDTSMFPSDSIPVPYFLRHWLVFDERSKTYVDFAILNAGHFAPEISDVLGHAAQVVKPDGTFRTVVLEQHRFYRANLDLDDAGP